MEKTLRNLILAGIGTIAFTYEKASKLIEELVEKGELTVAQGKELNEELKRKMKKGKQEKKSDEEILTVKSLKDVLASLNLATKQDLEQLEQRIAKLEKDKK